MPLECWTDDTPDEVVAKIAVLAAPHPDAQDIAARVAGAIGVAESAADREGIFWAVRTLLGSSPAAGPC